MLLYVLLLCSALGIAQVPAEANWKLVKQGKGIRVYTAPADSVGRKYIKVLAEMSGSLEQAKVTFQNIEEQRTWVYATKQASLKEKINENHLQYFHETAMPWPVSNRAISIAMTIKEDIPNQNLIIRQESIPEGLPPQKGIVEVPHFWASWQFSEVEKGQLAVAYYLDIDPGGDLPVWVVNLFVAKGPYETFVRLGKILSP